MDLRSLLEARQHLGNHPYADPYVVPPQDHVLVLLAAVQLPQTLWLSSCVSAGG